MNNRETLIEQYDDAVFALLMDEYAEDSGAELLTRFQEKLDQGLVPEFPEELDQRCIEIIDEEFHSRKRRAWLRSLCRGLIRLIFAIFFLIGLLLRTAWDIWQERRARRTYPAPETSRAENTEDDPPIFLTP